MGFFHGKASTGKIIMNFFKFIDFIFYKIKQIIISLHIPESHFQWFLHVLPPFSNSINKLMQIQCQIIIYGNIRGNVNFITVFTLISVLGYSLFIPELSTLIQRSDDSVGERKLKLDK
jgi:hypothetical protein